jgi:hypothetical protein
MTMDGVPVIGTNLAGSYGDMEGPVGTLTMNPDNWAAGTSGSYIIVGWSATLGITWSTVSSELADDWDNVTDPTKNYFFGVSTIGTGTPTASPSPADNLWNAGAPGFALALYEIPVPEPGTLALAAFGGASLLLFRRRK